VPDLVEPVGRDGVAGVPVPRVSAVDQQHPVQHTKELEVNLKERANDDTSKAPPSQTNTILEYSACT
jgi:hypothetical protein